MKIELSREDVEAMVGDELRRAVSTRLNEALLVSTETAAAMIDVSVNTFKGVARKAGLEPVKLAPRVIRWRMAEITKLGNGEMLK